MKTNVKRSSGLTTHEGAPSPAVSYTKQLRRAVMACMLFEDQFYEDGVSSTGRIAELITKVSFEDAALAAIDAREKFKLRHVPLLIVRELLRRKDNGRKMGDLIFRVIQRPDEMGELLALYWKDKAGAPLAAQLKIGLARALKKFNEYSLAKNDSDAITIRDVMFLTHPRPKIHDINENQYRESAALNKPNYKRGRTWRHRGHIFERIAENKMATPDTWETQLSAGADKKATFERLMIEKKIGGLALLRNLRNMQAAGVSNDAIWQAISTMKTDRILPFRFLSAAKYGKQFEPVLEKAMFRCLEEQSRLIGRTALLVDHSHSMNMLVSGKSDITRFDAASALAMMLMEICERCRVFTFSQECTEIAPRRGFAMHDALNAVRLPQSTMLGKAVRYVYQIYPECNRIIVITDEQSADRPPHPQGHGYIINVAGNRNGIAYGPWNSIDGWSEAVIDYMREFESDET